MFNFLIYVRRNSDEKFVWIDFVCGECFFFFLLCNNQRFLNTDHKGNSTNRKNIFKKYHHTELLSHFSNWYWCFCEQRVKKKNVHNFFRYLQRYVWWCEFIAFLLLFGWSFHPKSKQKKALQLISNRAVRTVWGFLFVSGTVCMNKYCHLHAKTAHLFKKSHSLHSHFV